MKKLLSPNSFLTIKERRQKVQFREIQLNLILLTQVIVHFYISHVLCTCAVIW